MTWQKIKNDMLGKRGKREKGKKKGKRGLSHNNTT